MSRADRLVRWAVIIALVLLGGESAYHFTQTGNPPDLALSGILLIGAVLLSIAGDRHG